MIDPIGRSQDRPSLLWSGRSLDFLGAVLGVGVICALCNEEEAGREEGAERGKRRGTTGGTFASWVGRAARPWSRTHFYNTLDGSTVWTRPTQPAGAANYT